MYIVRVVKNTETLKHWGGKNMKTRVRELQNKPMNDETYKLRRKVIDIIYSFKREIDLPRVTVRITDNNCRILGMGGGGTIWITEKALGKTEGYLRHVVAHEIGHAIFGLSHDESSSVMTATVNKAATEAQIKKFLVKNGRSLAA